MFQRSMVSCGIAVLAITTAMFVTASPTWAAAAIGAVEKVRTYAYGTPQGAGKGPLFRNDDVFTQELVETVTDGALHIGFADETQLRLGSNSQATLDRFVYNPGGTGGEMVARLAKGVFRYISGKVDKSGVRVLTPTVEIGIRGTDFSVLVADDGTTTVAVHEGEVVIVALAGGDPVSVAVGQVASVAAGSTTVSVSPGTSISDDPGLGPDAGTNSDSEPSEAGGY